MLAGAPNDGAWTRFCDALEWPELTADRRFHGNASRVEQRDVLIPMLEERFGRRPVAYWVERFEARSVACSPLHTVDQVMTHPQVLANRMRIQASNVDGTEQDLVGTPFKLEAGGGVAATAAPALAADTDAILQDTLGLGKAEIAALRSAGAFAL
jgi:crotonobetainyl-CoA:carnitine CoA-transferase CaiB-like acyl-CoA transferase